MDLDSFVPQGGGSLAAPAAPLSRAPVAQFTPTTYQHPDTIWSPRGSEIAPPGRPLGQPADVYGPATSERPAERATIGSDMPGHAVAGSMVRAALRGF